MRRSLLVIAVLLISLVLAPPAASQPAEVKPVNLRVTLTGTIVGGGATCCIVSRVFEGSAAVPTLGAVTFDGSWSEGFVQFSDPLRLHESLSLRFQSRGGDSIVLSGVTQWLAGEPTPPLTWTAPEATGRFSSLAGSGTYTVATADGNVTVVLAGTLRRAR